MGEFQLFYTKAHRCFIVGVVVVSFIVALVVVVVIVLTMYTLLLFENINDAIIKPDLWECSK